jgi:hypothetical protein
MNDSQRFPDASSFSQEDRIEEKMLGQQVCSSCCLIALVGFMILVSIAGYQEVEFPKSLLLLAIIWILTLSTTCWGFFLVKGMSQTRSCIVSKDFIYIFVPKKFDFRLDWSEIESIYVERRTVHQIRYREVFYDFHFQGKFEEQLLTLKSDHFSKRKIYQIIDLVEMYAQRLHKEFTKHQV